MGVDLRSVLWAGPAPVIQTENIPISRIKGPGNSGLNYTLFIAGLACCAEVMGELIHSEPVQKMLRRGAAEKVLTEQSPSHFSNIQC
jgi:hypothetical protein